MPPSEFSPLTFMMQPLTVELGVEQRYRCRTTCVDERPSGGDPRVSR